jgi:Zn finger protein HypA/HybF involved in hydrogenase expression
MHEMSIALEVLSIAEDRLGSDALADVVRVGLQVGDDSGVEINSLEFCLGVVLSAPPFGRAIATIERVQGDVLRVAYLEVEDGGQTN